jgi:chondroitin 4-sulfotransferase 11
MRFEVELDIRWGSMPTIKWSFAGHIARNITAWLRLEVGVLRQPEFEERDTIHERRLHRKLRQRRTQADVPGRKGIALGSNRSNQQLINEMQREAEVTAGTRSSRPVRWKGTRYIISDEHRFVYLAVPKVASTSILNSLLPFFDFDLAAENLESLRKGTPVRGVHEYFNRSPHIINRAAFLAGIDDQYDCYFKFTFVRNPWDRLLSCYMSKVVRSGAGMPMGKYGNVTLRRDMSFQEFAEAVCLIPDEVANAHFRSQHIFVCGGGSRKDILADYVGRFENLEEDFEIITKRIGIDAQLPHAANTSSIRGSRSYRDFYDEKLAEMVGERYREDIDLFGYSF